MTLLITPEYVQLKLDDLEDRIEIILSADGKTWHLDYLNPDKISMWSESPAVEETGALHRTVRYQFKAAVVRGEHGHLAAGLVKNLIDRLYERVYDESKRKKAQAVPAQRSGNESE